MNKDYDVLNELVPETQKLHRAIFDKGYEQGGSTEVIKDLTNDAYEKGLEDAWKCAKKIALNQYDGGIDVNVLSDIFGVGSSVSYKIFENFSVFEVKERIDEWEKKQEEKDDKLRVGKVKDLIQKLNRLPQDAEIYFCSCDNYYDAEVNWDITKEGYEKGYKDSPYIYLTKKGRR